MTDVISTARLDLHLISVENLITLFENPEQFFIAQSAGYQNPHRVLIHNSGPLRWRVPLVKQDPKLNKWFVRFVVLREVQEVVGSISFHNAPDAQGMLEVGLEIESDFQNKGYGTEALQGMWQWACSQPGVRTLRYTVSTTNEASQQLIKKFGFTHRGLSLIHI